jgi:hypothetical protein
MQSISWNQKAVEQAKAQGVDNPRNATCPTCETQPALRQFRQYERVRRAARNRVGPHGVARVTPTALDNGRRSPRKLLRAVVARLLGRKP